MNVGPDADGEPAAPLTYIYPGDVRVVAVPTVLSTILGSCVAVCICAPRGLAGMAHFLLPTAPRNHASPCRYGDAAIAELLALFEGVRRSELRAKIFGGAHMCDGPRAPMTLGEQNAAVARSELAAAGVAVDACDVGGGRGRRLYFRSWSGDVFLRRL